MQQCGVEENSAWINNMLLSFGFVDIAEAVSQGRSRFNLHRILIFSKQWRKLRVLLEITSIGSGRIV